MEKSPGPTAEPPGKIGDNTEASKFIYKPLNPERPEIRLLNLQPSKAGQGIVRCTLSHATLVPQKQVDNRKQTPAYEALSYVWGAAEFSSIILFGGQQFYVTPNLEYILRSLRRRKRSRVLWIDALCINQTDMKEREHQVSIMDTVYARCSRDLAWLEEPISGNSSTEEQRENLRKSYEKGLQSLQVLAQMRYTARSKALHSDRSWNSDAANLTWDLQGAFSDSSIWKRVWVVQELSLAPRVTLVCGHTELDWKALADFLKDQNYADAFHRHSHSMDADLLEVFQGPLQIEHQRRILGKSPIMALSVLHPDDWFNYGLRDFGFEETSRPTDFSYKDVQDGFVNFKEATLIDVLARFHDKASSVSQDKVYGLLGLVSEDHGIKVDYSRTVESLYRDVALSIIRLSGNLDIICQNPFQSCHSFCDKPKQTPEVSDASSPPARTGEQKFSSSWVPDLERPEDWNLFAQREIFQAGRPSCVLPCRTAGVNGEALVLQGCILDRIGPTKQVSDDSFHDIMLKYLGAGVLQEPHVSYNPAVLLGGDEESDTEKGGEPAYQAYWRCLVTDCKRPPSMRRLKDDEIQRLSKRHLEIFLLESSSRNPLPWSFPMLQYGNLDNKSRLVFAMSEKGLFLMVRGQSDPPVSPTIAAEEGDVIAVLDGGKVPVILREVKTKCMEEEEGKAKKYAFVCVTYVHGFMDGLAETGAEEGWLSREEFLLI